MVGRVIDFILLLTIRIYILNSVRTREGKGGKFLSIFRDFRTLQSQLNMIFSRNLQIVPCPDKNGDQRTNDVVSLCDLNFR